jgi:hypothetical protein
MIDQFNRLFIKFYQSLVCQKVSINSLRVLLDTESDERENLTIIVEGT